MSAPYICVEHGQTSGVRGCPDCGHLVEVSAPVPGEPKPFAEPRWIVYHEDVNRLREWAGRNRIGDSANINGDRLDNRRANLRVLTPAQNRQNTVSAAGSTSRYRGVTWDDGAGRWRAQVKIDGRNHYLGAFGSEDEAGSAAAAFRLKHMPFTNEDRTGAS